MLLSRVSNFSEFTTLIEDWQLTHSRLHVKLKGCEINPMADYLTPEPSMITSSVERLEQQPFLIIGLGNPGREFRESRHNAGFMVLDRLAARLGVSFSRLESKALVAKGSYQDRKLVLAKPQTYMNLSGMPVGALLRYYKIQFTNLLVVYDDVDLPLGSLRIRPGGGSGGQKGMASIIERLGTQHFPRLRVGIGRPPGRMEAKDYVLQDFSHQEVDLVAATFDRAVDAIMIFVTHSLNEAMNRYNG
jgi:PTH1 family peptidyl-tRNA hydrolase